MAGLAAMLLLGQFQAVPEARAGPLDAVVGVKAMIPEDARTAAALGRERVGSGVVIGPDGLVLTIGYVILEAISVEIVLPDQRVAPAEIVAYDHVTGFGLLRSLQPLSIVPVAQGMSDPSAKLTNRSALPKDTARIWQKNP